MHNAYADDTTLTAAGETVEEISIKMTENCELVNGWMKGNKLKLNASKTHLLTVGTGVRLRIQESSVVVSMDGCILGESRDKLRHFLVFRLNHLLNGISRLRNFSRS